RDAGREGERASLEPTLEPVRQRRVADGEEERGDRERELARHADDEARRGGAIALLQDIWRGETVDGEDAGHRRESQGDEQRAKVRDPQRRARDEKADERGHDRHIRGDHEVLELDYPRLVVRRIRKEPPQKRRRRKRDDHRRERPSWRAHGASLRTRETSGRQAAEATRAILGRSSDRSNGFSMTSAAARVLACTLRSRAAESSTSGMSSSRARSSFTNCHPSITGIIRSRTITSGWNVRIAASASCPFAAGTHPKPSSSSAVKSSSRMSGSSSTTSTRFPATSADVATRVRRRRSTERDHGPVAELDCGDPADEERKGLVPRKRQRLARDGPVHEVAECHPQGGRA